MKRNYINELDGIDFTQISNNMVSNVIWKIQLTTDYVFTAKETHYFIDYEPFPSKFTAAERKQTMLRKLVFSPVFWTRLSMQSSHNAL